jgi:hypothetical protein
MKGHLRRCQSTLHLTFPEQAPNWHYLDRLTSGQVRPDDPSRIIA